MLLGLGIGYLFKVHRTSSLLISAGTAICGGSAIAAVGPVLNAGEEEMAVSLGTVFMLNSVALFLFPAIGYAYHLTQSQFGLWAALAIHDTSSVVGATAKYGSQALMIGTTIKLARALWIVPLAFAMAIFRKSRVADQVGLVCPAFLPCRDCRYVSALVRRLCIPGSVRWAGQELTVTLYLMAPEFQSRLLKRVGVRPLLQGSWKPDPPDQLRAQHHPAGLASISGRPPPVSGREERAANFAPGAVAPARGAVFAAVENDAQVESVPMPARKESLRSRSVCSTLRPSVSRRRSARRWMCVSTGNAGSPKACAMTTEAVLCRARQRLELRITAPHPPAVPLHQQPRQAGDRPRFRRGQSARTDRSSILATGTRLIASGVRARDHRRGVTWFTRASVHCADSGTPATSRV